MTLTSSPESRGRNLDADFRALKMRILRKFHFKMKYWKIRTSEGNGVLHIFFRGKYIPQKWAAKYSDPLNSKIFEFNREVRELALSRSAAFYEAVSEMAVYGGTKFVERQTKGIIKPKKKSLYKAEEWIASKLMDVHAKVTEKDWTLLNCTRPAARLSNVEKSREPRKFLLE
jgi:hypothetical protein